jgi:hypothetical protein
MVPLRQWKLDDVLTTENFFSMAKKTLAFLEGWRKILQIEASEDRLTKWNENPTLEVASPNWTTESHRINHVWEHYYVKLEDQSGGARIQRTTEK